MRNSLQGKFSIWEIISVLILCLMVFGPASGGLEAQVSRGSMSGNVVDQTGASVPDADIRATSKETAQVYSTRSDSVGGFRISSLATGIYTVEVSKSGFQKLVMSGVEVFTAQDRGLGSLGLKVGEVTTTVEVTAAPALLQSTQAQISTSIKGELVNFFPGIAENQGLDNLALQVPGVVSVRDQGFSNTNGGQGFSVNGIRGRNNDQQIDGQNNNDNSVAGPYVFLGNADFVQEYQITTSNFGPEYGRNSGSVVNIITKQGTNNWHGSVFGTDGNSRLNSLSNTDIAFEKLKKPPRFNDEFTGGSAGGPLIRNRAFVFGGFDDEIVSQKQNYSTGSKTPTPTGLGQMAGCYPGSTSIAALQKYGPYGVGGGSPTPSGTPKLVTLTGANGNPCSVEMAGVQRTLSTGSHEYDAVLRLDIDGNTNRVYGRWIYQWTNSFNTNAFGTAAAGYPANIPALGQDFGMSWTHNFSSAMVNEARISYGRLTVEFGGNSIGNTIPHQSNIDNALARVTTGSGNLGFGPATNAPQGRIVNTYQLQDNLSYIRGRNQYKAGFNWTYQRSPNIFLPNFNGAFSFTNYSNFGKNIPSSINIALGNPSLDFREKDFFGYFGDDLKLKPNLTLNLGLTYSYFSQPSNLFNQITTKRESNASTAFFNPTLPLALRTIPALATIKNNFGPSIGFAYTPHWGGRLVGAGKTVLRGGYRLAYDPAFYNIYLNMSSAAPVVLLNTLTKANAVANPLLANPFGPAVRAELGPFLVKGVADPRSFNQTRVSKDFGPDHVHSWSFGIQRELSDHIVFEGRYVGNHGSRLFQSINSNPRIDGIAAAFPSFVPSGVTPCPAAQAVVSSATGREDCNRGVVRDRTNTGGSDYNALQLEVRGTNIKNQLSLRSGFTWSKTTDNVSEIFSTFGGGNSLAFSQSPFNFKSAEHGLSGLDIPKSWTLGFIEQLPMFRAQHGFVGKTLGGWGISGSYIIASGQPYSPVQFCLNFCSGGNVFDTRFANGFIGTFETARPFLSSPSAPAGNVGIFAGDLCNFDGAAGCGFPANTLMSFNAYNSGGGTEKTVTNGSVRYIVNGPEANTVFGSPFGSAGRNTLRDYQTNTANFELFKTVRLGERVQIRLHTSMVNVFNHPNFNSVDPFIDDAGFADEGNGFANPRLFSGTTSSFGQRQIRFGIKITY